MPGSASFASDLLSRRYLHATASRRISALLLTLLLGGVSSLAAADPPSALPAAAPRLSAAPGNFEEALRQLNADDYAQREKAQDYLMRQSPAILPAVETAMAETPESDAAVRLRRIAAHLFLKVQTRVTGAASLLGISLTLEPVRTGPGPADVRVSVAVLDLQPGFSAAESLCVGDRIIAVDGKELPADTTIDAFRRDISARVPGTRVQLTILRNRRQRDVAVTLAGLPDYNLTTLSDFVRLRMEAASAYLARLALRAPAGTAIVVPDVSAPVPQPPVSDQGAW